MTPLQHNTYFDDAVQSIGFERNGRRATVGVMAAGEYHFGTASAERMTVTSGALHIRLDGTDEWHEYPAGTQFEVAADSGFDVRVDSPTAYLCEFL